MSKLNYTRDSIDDAYENFVSDFISLCCASDEDDIHERSPVSFRINQRGVRANLYDRHILYEFFNSQQDDDYSIFLNKLLKDYKVKENNYRKLYQKDGVSKNVVESSISTYADIHGISFLETIAQFFDYCDVPKRKYLKKLDIYKKHSITTEDILINHQPKDLDEKPKQHSFITIINQLLETLKLTKESHDNNFTKISEQIEQSTETAQLQSDKTTSEITIQITRTQEKQEYAFDKISLQLKNILLSQDLLNKRTLIFTAFFLLVSITGYFLSLNYFENFSKTLRKDIQADNIDLIKAFREYIDPSYSFITDKDIYLNRNSNDTISGLENSSNRNNQKRIVDLKKSISSTKEKINLFNITSSNELKIKYQMLGEAYERSSEYELSSDSFFKASEYAPEKSVVKLNLKYKAISNLIFHFSYENLPSQLENTIEHAKTFLSESEEKNAHSNLNVLKNTISLGLLTLSIMTGNDEVLEEAENISLEIEQYCKNNKTDHNCFEHLLDISKIFRNRGSRTTQTEDGRNKHKDRLQKAIEIVQLAKQFANSSDEILKAQITYQYSLIEFYRYINNKQKIREIEAQIYQNYKALFKEMLHGYHGWYSHILINIALNSETNLTETVIDDIVKLLRTINLEIENKIHFDWNNNKIKIALFLNKKWKLTGHLEYLKQAINEYAQVKDKYAVDNKGSLGAFLLNYSVLLSDYGRETNNRVWLLKAIETFKESADTFFEGGSILDRRKALSEMLISVQRLKNIKPQICLNELSTFVEYEIDSINGFVEFTAKILNRTPLSSDLEMSHEEAIKTHRLYTGLAVIKRQTDYFYDDCFQLKL